MKIFDIIRGLSLSIDRHDKDYSSEYCDGYRDAISDMVNRIKDSVEVKLI